MTAYLSNGYFEKITEKLPSAITNNEEYAQYLMVFNGLLQHTDNKEQHQLNPLLDSLRSKIELYEKNNINTNL